MPKTDISAKISRPKVFVTTIFPCVCVFVQGSKKHNKLPHLALNSVFMVTFKIMEKQQNNA